MIIDAIWFSAERNKTGGQNEAEYTFWYITKGRQPDCVYFLDRGDTDDYWLLLTEFHVCGIKIK